MKALRYILPAALAIMAMPAASAADLRASADDINVYDLSVAVDEAAKTLDIDIDLDIARFKVGRDREIILTPTLIANDGSASVALDPIKVAGRNAWYAYLRNGDTEKAGADIYRAGSAKHATVRRSLPFEPWMGHSTLEMRAQSANCCDAAVLMLGTSPSGNVPLAAINTTRPAVDVALVFAPPVDAGPVMKSIEGSAFVTFVVNRTELNPTYMKNVPELKKIYNSINFVREDSDATITHVHIKGYASPEGPYDNNVRLAKGRTETLRRHVRDLYSFPDTTITSSYEPEDWEGLRHYLTDSMNYDIHHRAEILAIMDNPNMGADERDHAIRDRYPEDYRVILRQIYPWLRHSDYTVNYSIRTYTSLDDIRRVYADDPSRLRNVDFYTLAQSYPEGSDEYCEVFDTAVEVYPDDPMLNLNAANTDMRRGDLDAAQSHLLKAGNTPQANYARGVLAARRGDWTEAARRLELAKDGGMTGIDSYLEEIAGVIDYHPVTYDIVPLSKQNP